LPVDHSRRPLRSLRPSVFPILPLAEAPMHPLYVRASSLTKDVIGACVEVHRVLGPGLLESIYERCLLCELELRGIMATRQQRVEIRYKGMIFEEVLKFDVLVEGCLLLELKAVEEIHPIHKAKLLTYMKLLDVPLGLLVNFHEMKLTDGVHRLILRGAGPSPESMDPTY
jgi:GxxExxY protein